MKSLDNFETELKRSNEKFVETDLLPFLRIPSETLNKEGIVKSKEFIISFISNFCEEIIEYQGKINPLILAKVDGKSPKCLLIYMMYDTQPISRENEWISNPFEARIHHLPPPLDVIGNCIIARGAYNSKTPLLCFLNVVKELKKEGELPLSLLLLFDGEEKIGSPSLLEMLNNNKNMFKNCKDVYYPSAKQNISGKLVLKLGYKGILSITIKLSSINKEPHSAFSSMVYNPAVDLISLLSTIYYNNEFLIQCLKKPYDISREEQFLIDKLMKTLDLEKIKDKAGIIDTRETDPRKDFSNYLFKPTFNISTIKSGFMKEGTKNYIPNEAICNIDIRFAHKIPENVILKEIKEKVEEFSQSSRSKFELIKNNGYESSRITEDSMIVKSLVQSAKNLGVETEIWPISAAAAPLTIIQNILGLNYITGGLGIGGYAHSVNEFIQYKSIINQRLFYFNFLQAYSRLLNEQNTN
ncbi:MAG: M20/M25/M40 family metallo-hydrolase [Promethearchaeota archaeon]|jgi:acetylornithine deacetylase/succinyl-diaminopimelate desuccinylase-like protein